MESVNYTTFAYIPDEDSHDLSPFTYSDILWSTFSFMTIFVIIIFMVTCIRVLLMGQKTRSPQQRRMYVGTRARPSLGQPEPSIYVNPSNFPPPPKYECMAPPSYEEVVGVHFPNYPVQPITQPITAALAQTSADTSTDTRSNATVTIDNETITRNNETVTRSNVETIVTVPRTADSS